MRAWWVCERSGTGRGGTLPTSSWGLVWDSRVKRFLVEGNTFRHEDCLADSHERPCCR